MINGAHIILQSKNADADRAFFRDVLKFPSVDAGRGWLVFALPPAEVAFHPSESNNAHELYPVCDNLKSIIAVLSSKNVPFSQVHEERWGSVVKMHLPGGGELGLYQPKHPTALNLNPQ